MMHILLIGPMPPPIGGATVLFEQLVDILRKSRGLDLELIDTASTKTSAIQRLRRGARCAARIAVSSRRVGLLSFHASLRGIVYFSPFLRVVSLLTRRPLVLRVFGGGIGDWYRSAGIIRRFFFRICVLGADVVFFERKVLVSEFSEISRARIEWMPNSRPIYVLSGSVENVVDVIRFVFLAHVKPSKGINELLGALENLPSGAFSVDVYGPLEDGITEDFFRDSAARYCGVVPPLEVPSVLAQYDVLVLPTYYEGEGHPGVIIEAFGVGLAVIATRWAGIPEIITGEEGILVPPKNVDALAQAMFVLINNPGRVAQMKRAAKVRAEFFDSKVWAAQFIKICNEVVVTRTVLQGKD